MTDSVPANQTGVVSTATSTETHLNEGAESVQRLNAECFCVSLDQNALSHALESEIAEHDLVELIQQRCPHLFSARPVFLSQVHALRMHNLIRAIESVVALPAYREFVLADAPETARHPPPGQQSVFFGYDFHVNQSGFGLIEVNTNAGGAMLNAVLARAQRACCAAVQDLVPPPSFAQAFEERIVEMFRQEWANCGHTRPLASIAIVDQYPAQQYLYPEFLLFERLFKRYGIRAIIADPSALQLNDGKLSCSGMAIDLVYNRLTDFYLELPESRVLREACLQDAAVITPHPQAHALYADKRNLAIFSDKQMLAALGVPEDVQKILLASIPHTELVTPENADRLWSERKRLFFKPAAGFGSRAAYRGDKLTLRVWQEILSGQYVAQALVMPGERIISEEDPAQTLKFDLRAYAYDGKVQWIAARLYQGQTTNFRTPGGGFAPVYVGPF